MSVTQPGRNRGAGAFFRAVLQVLAIGTIVAASAVRPCAEEVRLDRVAVFGPDDRVAVPATLAGVKERLGLLYSARSRVVCSAFCVSGSVIATAAHCVFRTADEAPIRPEEFLFARNYGTDRELVRVAGATTGAASLNVVAGNARLTTRPPIDAANDWALLRLQRPVCAGHTLGLQPMSREEITAAAEEGRLFQLAYHRDIPAWRVSYSTPCKSPREFEGAPWPAIARDFADPARIVLHTCDTGGGSSGSPLLVQTPSGPVAVAINVGTYVQSKSLVRDGEVTHRFRAATIANTGVTVQGLPERLAAFEKARPIAAPARLRELQQRLKQSGHYRGAVDGSFGLDLRAAILAIEKERGAVPLGLPTEEVFRLLGDAR